MFGPLIFTFHLASWNGVHPKYNHWFFQIFTDCPLGAALHFHWSIGWFVYLKWCCLGHCFHQNYTAGGIPEKVLYYKANYYLDRFEVGELFHSNSPSLIYYLLAWKKTPECLYLEYFHEMLAIFKSALPQERIPALGMVFFSLIWHGRMALPLKFLAMVEELLVRNPLLLLLAS